MDAAFEHTDTEKRPSDDKLVYDKDFLLAMRDDPVSRKKPENLPDVIVADDRGLLSNGQHSKGGRTNVANPSFPNCSDKSSSQRRLNMQALNAVPATSSKDDTNTVQTEKPKNKPRQTDEPLGVRQKLEKRSSKSKSSKIKTDATCTNATKVHTALGHIQAALEHIHAALEHIHGALELTPATIPATHVHENEQLCIQAVNTLPTVPREDDRGSSAGANSDISRRNVIDDGLETISSINKKPVAVHNDKFPKVPTQLDEPLGSIKMFGTRSQDSNIKTDKTTGTNTANLHAVLNTKTRSSGTDVTAQPCAPQQQPNQPGNQSSLPMAQQQSMSQMFVPPQHMRGTQEAYYPLPLLNQMNSQHWGQQQIYQAQGQYMQMPAPAANPMPYYNGQRPQATFVQAAAPFVYQGQPLLSQFTPNQNPTVPYPFYPLRQGALQSSVVPPNSAQPLQNTQFSQAQQPPFQGQHNNSRTKVTPVIGPDTGVDRLNEAYEQQKNSHPPYGETSAKQTPQHSTNNVNKEVQTDVVKQVDHVAATEINIDDQEPHNSSLDHETIYHHRDSHKTGQANAAQHLTLESRLIRTLATTIFENSISRQKFVPENLQGHYNLLKKIIEKSPNYELQCLFALQALICKLEYPEGILLLICDRLYEDSVISRDSFIAWEISEVPAEQGGKGVPLNQLASFFTKLRENCEEYVSSSDDA